MVNVKNKVILIPDFMIALLFFREGEKTLSDIKNEVLITYSHLHMMKKEFLRREWCREEQADGRRKYIFLTEQGKKIADGIEYTLQEMGIEREDILKYKRRQKKHKTKGMELKKEEVKNKEEVKK